MCAALLEYGFSQLGFEKIGADAALSNTASDKILHYFVNYFLIIAKYYYFKPSLVEGEPPTESASEKRQAVAGVTKQKPAHQ